MSQPVLRRERLVRVPLADRHLELEVGGRVGRVTSAPGNTRCSSVLAPGSRRRGVAIHEEWAEPLPGAEEGEVEYAVSREEW